VGEQQYYEALLEAALHTQVCSRCHRAYGHEVRNSLQGLYGGFDAVTRAVQNKTPTSIPLDKSVQFVRQALTGHEQSLDRMLHALAPANDEPTAIDVGSLLSGLAKFLSSDAARHNVKIPLSNGGAASIHAQPNRLRLAFLSLMTDAIDVMTAGGEIRLLTRTQDDRVELEVTDTRTQPLPADPWTLDFSQPSLQEAIAMPVVQRIVVSQGGRIECGARDGGGRIVRMSFVRLAT
jgi:nitrogen-specific signal transduction histidine kinase